jgi:hypothetical protein
MESGVKLLTSTDLAQNTTTRQDTYGAVGATADGRRYRYVQFSGNVTGGSLVVATPLIANHQNLTVQKAANINDTTVFVTLGATAVTQDQYTEGLLVVGVDNSGVPVTRKIKGNTAGAASSVIQVALDGREPLLYALATNNVVSLSPSLFNGVATSATASYPLGFAVVSATANSFGWIQTFGLVGAVNDAAAALVANGRVKQSTTVAGAVVASTAATDIQIGTALQATNASKAGLVFVNLD